MLAQIYPAQVYRVTRLCPARYLTASIQRQYHFRMADAKADNVEPEVAPAKEEQPLPKLSPSEFRIYNRMADSMNYFVSVNL
jgi:hypothetical protein